MSDLFDGYSNELSLAHQDRVLIKQLLMGAFAGDSTDEPDEQPDEQHQDEPPKPKRDPAIDPHQGAGGVSLDSIDPMLAELKRHGIF